MSLKRLHQIVALEEDQQGVGVSGLRVAANADHLVIDPQLDHRDAFGVVEDKGGSFKVMNPPFRMSLTEAHVRRVIPALGEGTAEILGALRVGDDR